MTLRRLRVLLRALPYESEFKTDVRAIAAEHAADAKVSRLEDAQNRYRQPAEEGAQP